MMATIVLTGGWEVVFYLMCLHFAIDVFCKLPKILNWIIDKITNRSKQ